VHVGARQVFQDAGFEEVSRPTVRRVVMRIDFEQGNDQFVGDQLRDRVENVVPDVVAQVDDADADGGCRRSMIAASSRRRSAGVVVAELLCSECQLATRETCGFRR